MMQDKLKAEIVEIDVDQTGKLWLTVDGRCAIRIGECNTVIFRGMGLASKVDDDSNQVTLTWEHRS